VTPATIAIGIVTGAIGLAYFIYGKRQQRFAPLLAGLTLCVYPYFVDSVTWMIVIGVLLVAAPFVIDL
jgi:multisubunit Na+/H+ antiporter MnhC subunit